MYGFMLQYLQKHCAVIVPSLSILQIMYKFTLKPESERDIVDFCILFPFSYRKRIEVSIEKNYAKAFAEHNSVFNIHIFGPCFRQSEIHFALGTYIRVGPH